MKMYYIYKLKIKNIWKYLIKKTYEKKIKINIFKKIRALGQPMTRWTWSIVNSIKSQDVHRSYLTQSMYTIIPISPKNNIEKNSCLKHLIINCFIDKLSF